MIAVDGRLDQAGPFHIVAAEKIETRVARMQGSRGSRGSNGSQGSRGSGFTAEVSGNGVTNQRTKSLFIHS